MRVRPALGLKVRDPITKRHLPEDGKDVKESAYWFRRIACGDVVEVQLIPSLIPSIQKDEE